MLSRRYVGPYVHELRLSESSVARTRNWYVLLKVAVKRIDVVSGVGNVTARNGPPSMLRWRLIVDTTPAMSDAAHETVSPVVVLPDVRSGASTAVGGVTIGGWPSRRISMVRVAVNSPAAPYTSPSSTGPRPTACRKPVGVTVAGSPVLLQVAS